MVKRACDVVCFGSCELSSFAFVLFGVLVMPSVFAIQRWVSHGRGGCLLTHRPADTVPFYRIAFHGRRFDFDG